MYHFQYPKVFDSVATEDKGLRTWNDLVKTSTEDNCVGLPYGSKACVVGDLKLRRCVCARESKNSTYTFPEDK